MKKNNKSGLIIKLCSSLLIIIFLYIILLLGAKPDQKPKPDDITYLKSYEEELLDLSYLVLKASAINIIYGLNLERYQVEKLKELSLNFENDIMPVHYINPYSDFNLNEIKSSYIELLDYLYKKKSIPEDLKNKVNQIRIQEAEFIKKGLLGVQMNGYEGNKCLKCHAPPDYFPDGNISEMKTETVSPEKRAEIDKAHVYGIFGKEGTEKLWELKQKVDDILTSGQKYLLKNFRCCLIPPDDLNNPVNIGQAFVSDEWINYFTEVRNASNKTWKEYKQLYIIPLKDYIDASLPGINNLKKKKMIDKAVLVLEESRRLDKVDFELQKKILCLKLKDALSIDELTGEDKREKEERQFISTVYLLFPGNANIYESVLKEIDISEK